MSKDQEFSENQDDIVQDKFFGDNPLEENDKGSLEDSSDPSSEMEQSTGKEEAFQVKGEKDRVKRAPSPQFMEFFAQFEQETSSEEKIRLCIDFMRQTISQSGSPRFKDFWEGRRLCLPLFKENINSTKRAQLWTEYVELSAEGRRLKEILDEQSAFASEQIELAIQAIEKELEHYDELLKHVPDIEFPQLSPSFEEKKIVYNQLQRELHLLNTLASRVNALRKEIVKTEMRLRNKNKFFERLSQCGDKVFPRRKDLIKKISQEFIADVQSFIDLNFQEQEDDKKAPPLFVLREEIKALQSIAKMLTLNTHSFTETRLQLSECWDKVKKLEKERKKEFAQKKQSFKQNFDQVQEKIKAFAQECKEGLLSVEQANQQSNDIFEYMRTIELSRDDIRILKDDIHRAKRSILDKAKEEENERERREKELERQKKEKFFELKNQLHSLVENGEEWEVEALVQKRDELQNALQEIDLSKSEKHLIERQFKQIKDLIQEKKERALLNLSEDDRHALEQLKSMLAERKEHRIEIKNQLENYRKALGGSGFDFEKAMMYREMIEAEKTRLDKVNASIEEIEEKIDHIEGA